MKHLPKHLQPRYRYLALHLESWPGATLNRSAVETALRTSTRGLLGDVGEARADIRLLRFAFDAGSGFAIVRTRRDQVSMVRAAIACVSEIDDTPIGLSIAGISGTVRACSEKYIGERPEPVTERNVVYGSAQRPAWVRDDRVDIRTDGGFTGATNLDLE